MKLRTLHMFLGASTIALWWLVATFPDMGNGVLYMPAIITSLGIIGIIVNDTVNN